MSLLMNLMVVYRKKVKVFFVELCKTLFALVKKWSTMRTLQPIAALNDERRVLQEPLIICIKTKINKRKSLKL